jgi:hypothetical protein
MGRHSLSENCIFCKSTNSSQRQKTNQRNQSRKAAPTTCRKNRPDTGSSPLLRGESAQWRRQIISHRISTPIVFVFSNRNTISPKRRRKSGRQICSTLDDSGCKTRAGSTTRMTRRSKQKKESTRVWQSGQSPGIFSWHRAGWAERRFTQEVSRWYDSFEPPKPTFHEFQKGVILRCKRYLSANNKTSTIRPEVSEPSPGSNPPLTQLIWAVSKENWKTWAGLWKMNVLARFLAQPRLRNMQFQRRPRNILLLGNTDKIMEMAQFHEMCSMAFDRWLVQFVAGTLPLVEKENNAHISPLRRRTFSLKAQESLT